MQEQERQTPHYILLRHIVCIVRAEHTGMIICPTGAKPDLNDPDCAAVPRPSRNLSSLA